MGKTSYCSSCGRIFRNSLLGDWSYLDLRFCSQVCRDRYSKGHEEELKSTTALQVDSNLEPDPTQYTVSKKSEDNSEQIERLIKEIVAIRIRLNVMSIGIGIGFLTLLLYIEHFGVVIHPLNP